MLNMLTASLPLGKEVSLSKLARRTAVSETTAACGDGQAGSAGPTSLPGLGERGQCPQRSQLLQWFNPGPQTAALTADF